jgi:poly-beta-1,6-N-acetyl-D-glucosamine synthase
MTVIIILLFISYAVLVLLLMGGWLRAIAQFSRSGERAVQFISVVVPVRNEAASIGSVLNDLFDQAYPKDKLEIIVVDDHSEDGTVQVVEGRISNNSVTSRIVANEGLSKKSAITTGVSVAMGKIIVTTDADCRVGRGWLNTINDTFNDNNIMMVFGPVKIQVDDSIFSKIQATEFSSLIGSGAATMAFGVPTMCNGANLAFRKDAFVEVDGYEGNAHVASGDDEFLMRKIIKKYPEGIRFNASQQSIVSTKPQLTLSEFINQRIRWAGKWKFHSDLKSKVLAVYIALFQLSVLTLPVLVVMEYLTPLIAVIFLLVKAILELIFLRFVTSWLGVKWDWLSFIVLQFIYPLYVLGIGLASSFLKPVWKGRK